MRILLIEDEARLARNLRKGLQTVPSFVVDVSHDGEDGEHLALTNDYDLAIVDLMLPAKDGLSIVQSLRAAGRRLPILILTARHAKADVVRGLDCGADDYLGKPFDLGELIARCKALVRRHSGSADPIVRAGAIEVDTRRHVVRCNGQELALPSLEYRLIEYLAFHAGKVCSKTELLEHLYDYNWEKFSNVLEVYISSLRRKLEALGAPPVIRTVRNQGYVLEPAATAGEKER